jgi:protein-L-isoaspartate(D-aspartate) O-methyltransferase
MSNILSGLRKGYARKIRRKAHIQSKPLLRAFSEVPREQYLGPGPWKILSQRPRDYLRGRLYRTTGDAHPRHLYDDVLVGIFPERLLNNGQPSSLAGWVDHLDLKRGERVVHVGCGTGYYTAILAHVVGSGGHVTAVEIDDELAPRAKTNLAHLRHVEVVHGDGSAFDFSSADAVFVNAGATHVPERWIESMRPGARLMFPLITTSLVLLPTLFRRNDGGVVIREGTLRAGMAGVMLLVRRNDGTYPVTPVSTVVIFPCLGAIDRDADAMLSRALATGGYHLIRSLRRDAHVPDETCWLHRDSTCLSKAAIPNS